MKRLAMLLCMLVLSIGFVTSAYAERTTRDLVFEDDETETSSSSSEAGTTKTVGIKTTILLTRAGSTSTVLPSHEFKSGDSIKLVFTPSINGYVYWMSKGSTGTVSFLFPSAKAPNDNTVQRNQEYTVPMKGSFRFDDNAGKEELLCILSPERIAELDNAITSGDSNKQQGNDYVANLEQNKVATRKTRDLVFEDEDEGDVNTQEQPASVEAPLIGHYTLTHN